MRTGVAILAMWCAFGCTVRQEPPPEPPPVYEPPDEPPPAEQPPPPVAAIDAAPPAGQFAEPPPAPDAAPPPKVAGACKADKQHCCQPDGTIVKPGGCQPSYPPNVAPATERNADGTCKRIPCYLKCLPAATRIATPSGDVRVDALRVGDVVWTADAAGNRVRAPVERVGSIPVGTGHTVVELTLADGRIVRASAGHPTAGDATVGDLAVGDAIDGSTVAARRDVRYAGDHTWDLRPAGDTGTYWADGVLLGSTLE